MANEFKIHFLYNNRPYSARVVKSISNNQKAYAVRPFSIDLAKGFGPQTLIFKTGNRYSCESELNETTPGYVDAIVAGLKHEKE